MNGLNMDDIYNLLINLNKDNINWEYAFKEFMVNVCLYSIELTKIKKVKKYRAEESNKKSRRLSSNLLKDKVNKELNDLSEKMHSDPNIDTFYFPGEVRGRCLLSKHSCTKIYFRYVKTRFPDTKHKR